MTPMSAETLVRSFDGIRLKATSDSRAEPRGTASSELSRALRHDVSRNPARGIAPSLATIVIGPAPRRLDEAVGVPPWEIVVEVTEDRRRPELSRVDSF